MELRTQEFIRTYGPEELVGRFAISARRHSLYPNLVQFKYSQIDSPMAEPIVQECRGLILDEARDWRVVAYPYEKFFNYGEGHAAPVEWSPGTRVYEKLDGSLMTLYLHEGDWHVASSGLPDASGPVGGACRHNFRELFWRTWGDLGYGLPAHSGRCFMFELMTPYNRIVCRQERARIVLHGARDLESLSELEPEPIAAEMGWECVRSFPLDTLDGVLAAAGALDPMDAEGYVVRDRHFRRVKVKSPAYVALAHLKDGMTGRRLLEIVRSNESSEFLSHFPEFREPYERVATAYSALCAEVESAWDRIRGIADRKAFALEATKCRGASALFALRDGKAVTAREFFSAATLQSVERALGAVAQELVAPAWL